MRHFSIIVAMDSRRGIGVSGTLPWNLPEDMAFFKSKTLAVQESGKVNAVIMGRKTWESIPEKYRPLQGRMNCVISRNPSLSLPEGVLLAGSLDNALNLLENAPQNDRVESVFVIGGSQVFETALTDPRCETVYVTEIKKEYPCDTFFPNMGKKFLEVSRRPGQQSQDPSIEFVRFARIAIP